MTLQTNTQYHQSNLLRRTLQANGIFSGISGAAFIVAAKPLAAFLGLDAPLILTIMGVLLLLYAAGLLINIMPESPDRRFAWFAIISDVVWVLGSAVILFTPWLPLTVGGWWAVAIVADIVAVFAVLQFYGLRISSQ